MRMVADFERMFPLLQWTTMACAAIFPYAWSSSLPHVTADLNQWETSSISVVEAQSFSQPYEYIIDNSCNFEEVFPVRNNTRTFPGRPGQIVRTTLVNFGSIRSNASHWTGFMNAPWLLSPNNRTTAILRLFQGNSATDDIFCSMGVAYGLVKPISTWGQSIAREFPLLWRATCWPVRVAFHRVNGSCSVVLTSDGDLQLFNFFSGNIIWHTNTGGLGVTKVVIDDNGNLRLMRADNATVWQSQNHPDDPKCLVQFSGCAGKIGRLVNLMAGSWNRNILVRLLASAVLLFLVLDR